MTKTRTWGARAAAVVAAVGLLVGAGGVVNAAPAGDEVAVEFNIATGGTIAITGLVDTPVAIPVPDPNPAQVSGQWSPSTGVFTGNLTGAAIPISITDPVALTVLASLTATGVSGEIPADGSAGSVEIAGLSLNLSVAAFGVNCTLPVGDVALDATLVPGTPVGLSLGGEFVVTIPDPLPTGCELLAKLLGGATELPIALDLALAQVTTPPAPTPEPEPAPEPEAAPAAPAFTG